MDGVCAECRDYMAQGHGQTEALGCLLYHRSRTPGSPCHCRCVSRVSLREAVTLAASLGHIHCVNRLTRAGTDVNRDGEAEVDMNRVEGAGSDVNRAEDVRADMNEPRDPESLIQRGADVSHAEESVANVNEVKECISCARESGKNETVADVNELEQLVTDLDEHESPENCECGLIDANEDWNQSYQTGANVNKPIDAVVNTPVQVGGDVNRLKRTGDDVSEAATEGEYKVNRNPSHTMTVVKEPITDEHVEIQDSSNIKKPIEAGGYVNNKILYMRCKDDGGSVNRDDNLVHTNMRRHKQDGTSVNRDDNLLHTYVRRHKQDGTSVNRDDNLLHTNVRRHKQDGASVNRDDNLLHTNVRRHKHDGASVNRDDSLVHSALVSAVEHNQCDCTEMLVESGADVNACKSLVLVEAARTGHDKCLEILLNKATIKVQIDACESNKPSPLMWAVGKGHLTCAELLVKSGADVNQTFIEAVKNGDHDVAERLLVLGAGEKLRTAFGKKFFTYLFRKACHKCLESLLKKEKTEIREAFRTLLMCSTEKKTLKCMESLVEAGADVNTRLDNGYTAVMLAAKQGNQKCVQYLINKGANVDMVDHEQFETALLKASFNMHYGCARLLLLAGARVNMGSSKNEALFRTTVNKTMVLLLHAAGEILIIDDSIVRKFAGDIYCESNKLRLKHQCRRVIRHQMLEVDLYRNLILRVQRLGLPKPLVSYMLFNQHILDE